MSKEDKILKTVLEIKELMTKRRKYKPIKSLNLYNFDCPKCENHKLHPTKKTWDYIEFICNGCGAYSTPKIELAIGKITWN